MLKIGVTQVTLFKTDVLKRGKAETGELRVATLEAHMVEMRLQSGEANQLGSDQLDAEGGQSFPGGVGEITAIEARVGAARTL